MPLRLKKILGALLVVVFMLFWVWLAVTVSRFVPQNKVAVMLYYIVAGLGWGVPLFPLLSWMERTKR